MSKIASHNSWSYLKPKKWWMKLIRFTAQCQDANIREQYDIYGVRCFDLRIRFDSDGPVIVHNKIVYDYTKERLMEDLAWLNSKDDVAVRILLDVRTKEELTVKQSTWFNIYCSIFKESYRNIKFWGGRNLYDGNTEYYFKYQPTCDGKYSAVCSPKLIDDWYPRIFAKKNNADILLKGTDKDWLMIDFVNYGVSTVN